MVATHSCKESIWLKCLCSNIGLKQGAVILYCDSQSAICLARNLTFHARTKHIDVQYHFMRDMVKDGRLKLEKVVIVANVAEALPKPMSTKKIRCCSESMGLSAPSI